MITRRRALFGLLAAPAVVRFDSLMPIRALAPPRYPLVVRVVDGFHRRYAAARGELYFDLATATLQRWDGAQWRAVGALETV